MIIKIYRKQFLISESQIKKLESLAKKERVSAAEMVRQAIDAYNPDERNNDIDVSELLSLVHKKLIEAILWTKKQTPM